MIYEGRTGVYGSKQEQLDGDIKEMEKIVKKKPCKQCVHRKSGGFAWCQIPCDFYHSGFKRAFGREEDNVR